MVSLRFLESGVTVEGRIVEVDLESSPALLEVDFAEVTSLYEVAGRSPIPKVVSSITLRTADEELIPLDLASRRLFNFFDLVEGLRSIVNRSIESRPASNYAEPPVLVRLQVASPALIDLLSAPEVADLLKIVGPALAGYALKVFPQARKTWYEGTGQQLENELKRQKAEEGSIANQEKRLAMELRVAIAVRLGLSLPEGADDLSRAIDDHVLPALARLAEQGVSDVEVSTQETTDDPSSTTAKSSPKRGKPRKGQRNR